MIEGEETLQQLHKEYGDIPPFGHGPDQQKIHNRGNQYVRDDFPLVDFLTSCRFEYDDENEGANTAADSADHVPITDTDVAEHHANSDIGLGDIDQIDTNVDTAEVDEAKKYVDSNNEIHGAPHDLKFKMEDTATAADSTTQTGASANATNNQQLHETMFRVVVVAFFAFFALYCYLLYAENYKTMSSTGKMH